MQTHIHRRPTIGVLAGWQIYEANVHAFLNLTLQGIHSSAQKHGCNLLLACGLGHEAGEVRLRPAWPVFSLESDFVPVGSWNTDGLIVINPLITLERSRYIQRLISDGHPVVFIGTGEQGNAVVPDNELGVHLAMQHFVEHGHRRIAFIAGHQEEKDADSFCRLRAYREAVQKYHLENDQDLIAYGLHDFNGGRHAMKQLLEGGKSFTAVLVSNDTSAFGAIQTIKQSGLRIPQDIAVIGFDDLPDATGQDPQLTTVHYPIIQAGRTALSLALDLIHGRLAGSQDIRLPMYLIVRESCGCSVNHHPEGIPLQIQESNKTPANARGAAAKRIVDAIQKEIQFLDPSEVRELCVRLVDDFSISLNNNETDVFFSTFMAILHRLEESGDDPHVLHPALSILAESSSRMVDSWNESIHRRVEIALNQAYMSISASIRRQYKQYVSNRDYIADQMGLLTSHLFMAVDQSEIFAALAEYLPRLGINRAFVAFFEPESNNWDAESIIYSIPDSPMDPAHLLNRQFPSAELISSEAAYHLAIFPLIIEGKEGGFVAFDLTLHTLGADELADLVNIVRRTADAFRSIRLYREAVDGRRLAEEANRMKSRFLSMVSHELRTPLNLIVGLSDLILQEETMMEAPALPPSRRQDLERIHESAEHLGRLIRDVLDLATSQAGQLRLELEPLDVRESLHGAIQTGEELVLQKGLEWKISIDENLPRITADGTRLAQVLLNLISNAVKFTERGHVELRIEARGADVLISIQDTGLGIPPKEQDLIFDEFRQSDRTTARGYGGLGLGLAITKRLVELHGGRIWVESDGEIGSGSRFSFSLPAIPSSVSAAGASSPDLVSRVALLVEKPSGEGEQLHEYLSRQGYQIEIFQVDETLDWMSHLRAAAPGAIVLGATLATKLGWEIIKALKENQTTHDIPVVFYSLTGNRGSILEVDYLVKPIGGHELARSLESQGFGIDGPSQGSTILIVDDEPGILEMHTRIVHERLPDCRVLRADNGVKALDVIRQEHPDLVLLDLMMPQLDGFGVLKAMREGETTRDIPVIVLTGQVLTEDDMARLNLGVASVLQKGIFSAQETMAHVEAVFARVPRLGSQMQRIVRKAVAYLNGHYSESFSRKDIAHHIGISDRYLTRCFRQEMGITPLEYLNRYRIKKAAELLESGQNVTETTFAVGFSSVSYFSRLFEKGMGLSPSAYRRK
ncbi:MAG: substrate-binding domain-containing protein [Anaerolineales bacterium]